MLRSKNGSAIIIVLIISMIAMSLTLFSISISRKIISSSNMLMDKLHAKLGAESDIEKLKFYITTGKFYPFYIENSYSESLSPKIYIDGREQKIDNNTTLKIQDTGGLIDVWAPNTKIIKSLLEKDNVSQTKISIITDSIKDWYDKDDLKHINGAENTYYRFKGYNYTPRNFNAVQSIYEWHIIRGLTDNKTFDFLKKYLTISVKWHPNINTMDKYMISAFFNIPLNIAENILTLRHNNGFITPGTIQRVFGLENNSGFEYISFPTFILDINAKFRFNEAMEKVSCIISFISDNSTPYRILKWQN